MSDITYTPANTLAEKLCKMAPGEVIRLGIALCRELESTVEKGSRRGSIWPENVTYLQEKVAFGPVSDVKLKDMSPEALEYIAPEQFWNGEAGQASDVYSVGLILYTALNGGRLPFFPDKEEFTSADRAAALQKRMRDTDLPYPRFACRELGDVVLTAVAFRTAERYSSVSDLRQALEALPESAAIPAVAPVIRLKPKEVENARSYKVDKEFEKVTPTKEKKAKRQQHVDEDMDVQEFRRPRKKKNPIIPLLIIAVLAAAVVLILSRCGNDDQPQDPGSTSSTSQQEEPSETPTSTSPDIVLPLISPEVSDDPVEPSEPPIDEPIEPTEPTYTVIVDDVTWEEARAACEAMGGHLATVNSQEELQTMISLATEKGASFVWLGSYRGSDGQWYHVTGEQVSFFAWDHGEPSVCDADGTPEDYLLLWYRQAQGTWTYNDMRNDPISVLPATYSGKTAYICQFD